jgi:RNA polymerase sigma-70 factor, ECF subfamily
MRMLDSTDATLIEFTLKGDEQAFAELVRRYQAAVWGTVYRTLGNSSENEDAVQEVFMRAYTSLRNFNCKYPFGPWILRIATNYCIDQLRRKRVRKCKLWTELTESEQARMLAAVSPGGDYGHAAAYNPDHFEDVARVLLNELGPKHRTAFVLRELEGHSYEEVAKALGTSEVAARVRVSRARAEVQQKLRKYLDDYKLRRRG